MGQIRLRVQVLCFLITQLDTQYGDICWVDTILTLHDIAQQTKIKHYDRLA